MKCHAIVSLICILLVSFVISNEESSLKFLTLGKNENYNRNQPTNYVKNSYFEMISEKEDEIHQFLKNHTTNKFVNLLGYPVNSRANEFECEDLSMMLTTFNNKSLDKLSECLKAPLGLNTLYLIMSNIHKTAESNRLESILKLAFNEADYITFFEITVNQHSNKLKTKVLNLTSTAFKNEKFFILLSSDNKNFYNAESLANLTEKEQIEEMTAFMDYLEILLTEEIKLENEMKKLLFVPPIMIRSSTESGSFDLLTDIFEKIKGGWSTILSIFHSSSETTIKKLLIDTGYSKYDNSVQVQIIHNMRKEGLAGFYDLLERRIKLPVERKNDVTSVLEGIEWSETNAWTNYDVAFSINSGGEVKYVSLFANRGKNDTFNFIITEVFATFILAPDIMIVTKKLSILGGLWNQRTVEIQFSPRYLKDEDLESIFNFFQIIIYKQVASQFGINLELPK
jgi:hypothetical protein